MLQAIVDRTIHRFANITFAQNSPERFFCLPQLQLYLLRIIVCVVCNQPELKLARLFTENHLRDVALHLVLNIPSDSGRSDMRIHLLFFTERADGEWDRGKVCVANSDLKFV